MTGQRMMSGAVAVAAIAGVIWAVARDGSPDQDGAAGDPARRELAGLRAEVADLRGNVQVTRALAQRASSASPAPASAPAEEAAVAVEDVATIHRVAEPVELAAQLDGRFAAEPIDPAWGQEATRLASDALASALPAGTHVVELACRASLCRVASVHGSVEDFRAFVDASFLRRDRKLWNAGFTSIVTETSGTGVKAVSFIAREGQSIPAMDPEGG